MSAVSLLKGRRRECNSPVVRAKLDRTGLREQPADPTLRRDQLRDRVLGRDRILQDRGVQHPPAPPRRTAVAATSKTRRGRCERLIRLRQYTSTVGWNPSSSNRSPQATFQAMSRRSALTASRSLKPSNACSTMTLATTSAGTDGWPRP